jgi:K+-transporting ATPase KdpF subunit
VAAGSATLEHTAMDHPEYLVVGIIAALIAVYLFVALLFPERF